MYDHRYTRWTRMGQEREALLAGYKIATRFDGMYEVTSPDGKSVRVYKNLGSVLNYTDKQIKQRLSKDRSRLSKEWKQGLERIEQARNKEIPQADRDELLSNKYI